MEAKYILPKITVQPTRGLVDEMFYIAVSNISPHQEVTIRSFLQSDDKDFWHAYAYYVSDNSGVVNGPGPFPGLLDLWGGGGGLVEYRSALLASHGYATLALEYLSSKTEFSKIGEKYFEAAFGYLESHPQVTREHVGIFGLCFGASVTLSVAANENKINPKCLVCVSGTHVIRIGESIDKAFADLKLHVPQAARWSPPCSMEVPLRPAGSHGLCSFYPQPCWIPQGPQEGAAGRTKDLFVHYDRKFVIGRVTDFRDEEKYFLPDPEVIQDHMDWGLGTLRVREYKRTEGTPRRRAELGGRRATRLGVEDCDY
ncbi:BAAT acyltransferase, partial [Polypterus senegalus]